MPFAAATPHGQAAPPWRRLSFGLGPFFTLNWCSFSGENQAREFQWFSEIAINHIQSSHSSENMWEVGFFLHFPARIQLNTAWKRLPEHRSCGVKSRFTTRSSMMLFLKPGDVGHWAMFKKKLSTIWLYDYIYIEYLFINLHVFCSFVSSFTLSFFLPFFHSFFLSCQSIHSSIHSIHFTYQL